MIQKGKVSIYLRLAFVPGEGWERSFVVGMATKTRLIKVKLLKPGQNSYSRLAIFDRPAFAKVLLCLVLSD